MKTKKLLSCLLATIVSLGFLAKGESQLISRLPKNGVGKQIVSIHSFSAQTKPSEGAVNMLIPDMATDDDKWCDASTAQPWTIFELSNIYDLDKFVITDAQIREAKNGNIAEYKIFVTTKPYDEVIGGWDDADWTEVAYRTGEGTQTVKTVTLDAPVAARYVKFLVLDKGVRADNGNPENAVRIYGFDMYGTFDQEIDRGNLISVGKTILAADLPTSSSDTDNKRETAINIIDGNRTNIYDKWCFGSYGATIKQRYAVIDLERQYNLSSVKLYDGNYGEPGSMNLSGCNIYVSKYAPDLSLIDMYHDDTNTCWTKVVDSNGEDVIDIKDYPLTGVTGRFVKIEFPYEKAGDPTQTSRIFEAEIYGTEAAVGGDDATLSLLSVSKGTMSPKFSGDVYSYTVNVDKEIESVNVLASATNKDAVVTGTGTKALSIGTNNFDINVVSKDGSQTLRYSVAITRADKSKISTLKTLSSSVGFFSPAFNPDSLNYFVDVPSDCQSIVVSADATQENAQISGIGEKTLTGNETIFNIVVTGEDGVTTKTYKLTANVSPVGLISVNYGQPTGKRIVNIHSYSNKANDTESPYKLLLGKRLNTNGNTGNKWCDNKTDQPWVIFSLTDIYKIDSIMIRDGRTIEQGAINISGFKLEFSTTGTDAEDFNLVDEEFTNGENTININYLANNARYIKLSLYKGFNETTSETAGAVWIYGVDIFGKKAEDISRGKVVSTGKTIVGCSSYASDRETPANLVDGNISYDVIDPVTEDISQIKCDPWSFNVSNGDGWAVIDLEKVCKIDSFKVYDTNDWLKGYKVLVNSTGNDADWTEVYSGTYLPDSAGGTTTVGPDPKIGKLINSVSGRFVKLFVPVTMQSTGWNRLREFEVYGDVVSGIKNVAMTNENLVVYPNPVNKGNDLYVNEAGVLKIYSLQGSTVFEKAINGPTHLSTSSFVSGSYIIQLSNNNVIKRGKLIVR